ncbi:MAG: TetR family transcriptional regulator [Acidimicrobiia bacterium]|nr:TetR family transcriptional regulator [Acidimicrobiia bacterium]
MSSASKPEPVTPVPFGEAARALMQTTILAAVRDLMDDRPWSSITMADVARRAGVSRQTLYNEFGGRKDLARAYALDVADSLLDRVEAEALSHAGDPRAALLGAFSLFLTIAADEPIVRALTAPSGADDFAALVGTPEGVPILNGATERIRKVMRTLAPLAAAEDVAALADVVVRLAMSHLSVPGGSVAEATEALTRVVGPALDTLAAGPARTQVG